MFALLVWQIFVSFFLWNPGNCFDKLLTCRCLKKIGWQTKDRKLRGSSFGLLLKLVSQHFYSVYGGGLSWSLFSSKQHESCAWATNALTRYSPSMWKFIRKAISVHKSLGVNSFWRIILVVFILFVIKKLLFSCPKNIKWVRCFRNLRKKVDTTFVSNLFLLLHGAEHCNWFRACVLGALCLKLLVVE